ncbi:COX15/CtaA family protein [Aeromicrobium duanguangcaii]|uniref:COX15/CtaA family protein n=1 Tax=Aeromicrobium duanguangcaii TaxID=2968086 RepID=A0ABY5KA25_9ACTN|nr:COX15/CtaA family protein [Aeromicrobium duanguangcaii]MCL3837275.1 COX15/CtaA family protein [Aeromicrobium duanguangcaii]UUI67307.1 COX15/CtaA family protein [Aeromicrobium duanguangcaii]
MGMNTVSRRTTSQATVEKWAWANLVANTLIILTGGLVRLTGSGLGCPTWPRCTDESFVPHGALGWHGVIEFGNRTLTYVLIVIAIGTVLATWRWTGATRTQLRLVLGIAIGIPFQGVIGGITVLTDLNPWIVSLHLILSMGLVVAATIFLMSLRQEEGTVDRIPAWIVQGAYVVLLAVIYLGTIVTGSGPHAGDANAPRNELDPVWWSRIHAISVWTFLILTVAAIVLTRGRARQAGVWVLVAGLAQGLIGYVQYFTDLPIVLVATHLVGAAVLLALATRWLLTARPVSS